MSAPRGLSEEESEAWEKLAATVTPMHPAIARPKPDTAKPPPPKQPKPRKQQPAKPVPVPPRVEPKPTPPGNLDSHWDRRLKSGALQPDLTLDLHGYNLDAAYDRLAQGLSRSSSDCSAAKAARKR